MSVQAREEARRAKQEEEFKADIAAMEKKRKAKDLEAKKSLLVEQETAK